MVIIRNIIHIGKKDSYPSLNPALHFTPRNLKIFLSKTFERKKNKFKWKKELLNFLEFCQRLFFCSCYLGFCFSIHHLSFNKHYFYTSSTAPLWCSPWFVRQAGRVEDIFISLREAALSKNVEKSKIEATLLKPLLAISAIAAVHLPTVYGLIGLRDVNAPHCSIDTEGGG